MSQQCPLLFRQVDATVTRINTLFVSIGIVVFLITHQNMILVFLMRDFLLRLYGFKHLSPINLASLALQKKFSLKTKMEDAGAKRLAALFGLGFTLALFICSFSEALYFCWATAGIFLFCAGLELIFGYCIACKIYYLARKIYPKGFQ